MEVKMWNTEMAYYLNQEIILSDGTKEKVFTLNKFDKAGQMMLNCQLCHVPCISKRNLECHEMGKRHQRVLQMEAIHAGQFRSSA